MQTSLIAGTSYWIMPKTIRSKDLNKWYLNNVQRLERKFVESSDSKWEASLQKQINKEEEIVQSI